jgi:acetoacetate decarboxylase
VSKQPSSKKTTSEGYPPAPWRSTGQMWAGVFHTRTPLPLPDGMSPILNRGWQILLLVRYLEGTLTYDEFGIAALGRIGMKVGMWVHHLWVDSEASMWGGRKIWGLNKEMANFTWEDDRVYITDGQGPIAALVVNRKPATSSLLPLGLAGVGALDGQWAFASAKCDASMRGGSMRIEQWNSERFPLLSSRRPVFSVDALPVRFDIPAPKLVPMASSDRSIRKAEAPVKS